jgi:stage III sporulation protein SpoIIIAA
LKCLPADLTNLIRVESAKSQDSLLEVVVDLGRAVALRFSNNKEISFPHLSSISPDVIMRSVYCSKFPEEVLDPNSRSSQYLDEMLTSDNRTGLRNTLHRISAMRARDGSAQGVTIRIGRQISGVAMLMFDILKKACNLDRPKSVLLLGRPGKTTLLRDVAYLLANEFERRVISAE